MVASSPAQTPTVHPRQVADPGPATKQPTEPEIAVGAHTVVAVSLTPPTGALRKIYYAARPTDRVVKDWARDVIENVDPYSSISDVAIAYDSINDRFLAVGKGGGDVTGCLFEVNQHTAPEVGPVTPSGWSPIYEGPGGPWPPPVDKPWIVAGNMTSSEQEFYLVFQIEYAGAYQYLHTTNGGADFETDWYHGVVQVGGQDVTGGFGAQPTVSGDGPLYAAYIGGGMIHFLKGTDQPGGSVSFERLMKPGDPDPVPLTITLRDTWVQDDVPVSYVNTGPLSTIPFIVADPSSASRIYLAYHDVDATATDDVNIYLAVLEKQAGSNLWNFNPADPSDLMQVNDADATTYESDQFMPVMAVDDTGRIHIIYYDDQDFTDGPSGDLQPDVGCEDPKFNVYYSYSSDQGDNWFHEKLRQYDEDDPPAFDWGLLPRDPREYNGIDWRRDANGVKIWTVYSGTDGAESGNRATIWSTLIEWPN